MQRTAPPAKTSMLASFGKAVLAIVLVVSLTPFVPTTAYADAQGTTIAEQLREANAQIEAQGFTTVGSQSYNWLEDEAPAAKARNAALPSSYDLRDAGVVTPVKLQNPWGTCWGFTAIAASETSILSELKNAGKDYSSSSPFYDLSERQLAWFAYSPIPANDPNGQGGEGQANMNENPNAPFNTGGLPVYATSIFSSGIGPLDEETVPYQNEEEKIEYQPLLDADGNPQYDEDGELAVDETKPLYYSTEGTWAVTDESLRYAQVRREIALRIAE